MILSETSLPKATLAKLSSKTLRKKTGRDWGEWIDWLDAFNAAEKEHQQIVALLADGVESPWYRQKIAQGYREARGFRGPGQISLGYEIGVSRTFLIPVKKAWEMLMSEEGMAIWLGKLRSGRAEAGVWFATTDGITGKINVLEPYSHFRMSWKPDNWRTHSILQVRVMGSKSKHSGKSVISFHHEQLPDATDRAALKGYWEEKLGALTQLIERK